MLLLILLALYMFSFFNFVIFSILELCFITYQFDDLWNKIECCALVGRVRLHSRLVSIPAC